ncbi:GNAT family N-acetyltransferase [Janthinobacterium sp. BJB303]|nr:GNAT family N-acetyltransferase [Janthinobacterium sp. BJB303]
MLLSLPEVLRTPRLTLRKPRTSDSAVIFDAYAQDTDVVRYMAWRPHRAIADTEAFIAYCIQEWDSGRSRPYVLARQGKEDQAIGMLEASLHDHMIDIGYVLQRKDWGAGFMSEAVHAVSEAALALPHCFRVQASCDTENRASARTLEKAGFVLEGKLARHLVLPNLAEEPRQSLLYARCR